MTRRKRQAAPRRPDARWVIVRHRLRCTRGHDVAAGSLVRFGGAGDIPTCEGCCERFYGLQRPERPFVFRGDEGLDVKANQAGSDE